MAKTSDEIKASFLNYIGRQTSLSNWYVGITNDPRSRLFSDHGVMEKGDRWIYESAQSNTLARALEKYFLDLGADGGGGGGDATSKSVYAYQKAGHTSP